MPPAKVCVYFSQNGGAVLAVTEDPAGDPAAERAYDQQGINWGKATIPKADAPAETVRPGAIFDVATGKVS